MPSIGGRSGNEPVATIAFLNGTSSPPSTAIVFGPVKRPRPLTHSTPFALKSPAIAARHLLDDAVLPLDGLAEVRAAAGSRRRRTSRRPRRPGASRARSAPTPSSGCSRRAGTCRRARAPPRRRRSSRPTGRRGSLPCTRRGLRPGRRRHIPSLSQLLIRSSDSTLARRPSSTLRRPRPRPRTRGARTASGRDCRARR